MKLSKTNCKQIVNEGGGRVSYKLREDDMQKKGFTLIELLAVIVILAIIALITVPLILNVIETAKRGSFKDTAYGLIESAELYYSKEQLKGNNLSSKTFTFPDAKDLGYKGEKPKSGNLVINQRGQVALAISNDKYCITKGYNETEVTVSDTFETCEIEIKVEPNEPDLLQNMVPVKYNGENWVYANSSDSWYNYDNKEWANAVVLNSGVTKNVGDTISESDVALWYVWVPRYKYQLFNVENTGVPEQEIAIQFESGTETTGTVTCTTATNGVETCTNAENGNWYTHPAFTLGTQQLTGLWVGKFEVSTTDTACNSSVNASDEQKTNCNKELPVTIKPGISSWRSAQVVNFFNSIQKMSNTYSITDGDSHMMKNSEWGAVAYLKQSKYGLGTTDIVINNSSYITGGGSNNAYKTETKVKQSTTGNITGIYDMSGGSFEYVMGNMVKSSGAFYSSSAGFTNAPDSKYYDSYSYDGSSYTTHARGHLGDATKETLKTFGSNTGGWYSDYAYFPRSSYSWFVRGGSCSHGDGAGVFYFGSSNGNGGSDGSARAVLARR